MICYRHLSSILVRYICAKFILPDLFQFLNTSSSWCTRGQTVRRLSFHLLCVHPSAPLNSSPSPHAFYFHFLQTSFSFSLHKIHKLRFPHICILMALSERRAWRSETYLLHNGMQAVLSFYITNAWGPPFSPYLCPHWPDGVCSLKSIEDDCHPPSRVPFLHPLIPLPTNFSQISAHLSFEVDRKFLIDSFMLFFLACFLYYSLPSCSSWFYDHSRGVRVFFLLFMVKVLFLVCFSFLLHPPLFF